MQPDEFEADNGPTFKNDSTEIIYDVDGEQHVIMLDNEECS